MNGISELHMIRERRIAELLNECRRKNIYTKNDIKDMAKVRYGVNEQTARDYADTIRSIMVFDLITNYA